MPTHTVAAAIAATPSDYMTKVLAQRNEGPESLGSTFLFPQTAESLAAAQWEVFHHDAISAPATGYRASIPGKLGVVRVGSIAGDLFLSPSRKGTGFMEVVIKVPRTDDHRPTVEFSVALVGPGDGGLPVLWTVFPGDPIAPSTMEVSGDARPISVAEAKALGFEFAKVELI